MRRTLFCLAALALLSACGGDEASESEASAAGELVAAQVASYDLAADGPQRFMVGLSLNEGGLVVGGTVEMRFEYRGAPEGSSAPAEPPAPPPEVTGEFLELATTAVIDDESRAARSGEGGVYLADDVEFAEPGFWEVEVSVVIDGEPNAALAAFEVLPDHQIVNVGDPAPHSENLLPGDPDAPVDAIDSRAEPDGSVPDPVLHRLTVADAIATGDPTLVVVSTPVYCVSRFCGPITEAIQSIAGQYRGRANFIHVEVWRDFENNVVNQGAADWIYPDPSVEPAEPWVFLIDSTGTVVERWDNVANEPEMTNALDSLVG